MDFGVQLFAVAKEMRENPGALFKNLADMGYKQIEPCIMLPAPPGAPARRGGNGPSPFLATGEIDAVMDLAAANGLYAPSCHIFGDLLENMGTVEHLFEKYGIKQFINGGVRELTDEAIDAYAMTAHAVSKKLRSFGAELLIHNGAAAVQTKIGEKSALEVVLDKCGGDVGVQVDTGYVLYAGEDPVGYMLKLGKYVRSVHYKEMSKNYADMTAAEASICLGKGALDARGIYDYAAERGLAQIIDQDKGDPDIMEDLAYSVRLLNSFGM